MLKCNWGKNTETRLIIAAVSALIIGILTCLWLFYGYQQEHAEERQAYASYQNDRAKERFGACNSIIAERGFRDWLLCLNEAITANINEKKAGYDLKAQQDMAEWNYGSMLVAVLTFYAGGIGLIWVYLTLKATRDMASHDRKMGELEYRPMLVINKPIIKDWRIGARGRIRHLVGFDITNEGKTAAKIREVQVYRLYKNGTSMSDKEISEFWSQASVQSKDKFLRPISNGQPITDCPPTLLIEQKFEVEQTGVQLPEDEMSEIELSSWLFRSKCAFVGVRVSYGFAIGKIDDTFEATGGYFLKPIFNADGTLRSFHCEPVGALWNMT